MSQGGEFAFVLYGAAAAASVITPQARSSFSAMVVLSMALTPLVTILVKRFARKPEAPAENAELDFGLPGRVLMVGFGRFGQVVSQSLLARDVDVTIIDTDVEMIQTASEFGFKIYFGDGTRLDVLEAAGAGRATVIAACVDDKNATNRIVELCNLHFPQATLMVRAYDREHAWHLAGEGVRFYVRETFESAMQFGTLLLGRLGVTPAEASMVEETVRTRDAERFAYELSGGDWVTGATMSFGPGPTPFTPPRRAGQPLTEETRTVAEDQADETS